MISQPKTSRQNNQNQLATTQPKNKKNRQKKSLDDKNAQLFLKKLLVPYKKQLMIAWWLDVLAVGLLIGQAVWISGLFGALFETELNASLDSVQVVTLLWQTVPYLLFCVLLRPVVILIKDNLLLKVGMQMSERVRQLAMVELGRLGLARVAFGSDGVLASYVLDEPEALAGYLRFSVQKMTAVSTPIIIAGAIMIQSLTAGLILLATAPLVPIFMAIIGMSTAKKSREQMDALAQLGGRFLDWLRGMNTLVRLGAVGVAGDDVAQSSENYKKRTMSVLKVAFLNTAVLEFLSALSIALVAVYLGFGLMGLLPWSSGVVLTSYTVALFILLLVPEFYAPLRRLGAEYHAKGVAESAAKVLAKFLGTDFVWQKTSTKAAHIVPLDGQKLAPSLSLQDLSVVGSDGRCRLARVNLQVPSAQVFALVGASGSGKTTIFQALLGFVDYQGQVLIDGVDLTKKDTTAWRTQVGYLSQTPALLPLTILENLQLANRDVDEAACWAVLTQVGLADLIKQLPDGIHTQLSERGGGLSGGQAQRLAIAQLLLQQSQVWLLDEPTEHLDGQTKAQIHALLKAVCQNKTVLWATHDTPVAWVDGIYDLKDLPKPSAIINHQSI